MVSENIFQPYLSNQKTTFVYDRELGKFIGSVLWRTATVSLDEIEDPVIQHKIIAACSEWKDYLLSNIRPKIFDEFHLLFVADEWGDAQPHSFVSQYFTRVVDCHVIELKDNEAWVCLKFARFLVVGRISGNVPTFRYSQVYCEPGMISAIQYIDDPKFSKYLIDRSAAIYEYVIENTSVGQSDIIQKHFEQNAEKIMATDLGKRIKQDYSAEIVTFVPDLSFKYACDCCARQIAEPEGYILRTFEILLSAQYWKQYFRLANLDDIGKHASGRVDHFKAIAGQDSPWVVCEVCIDLFDIDKNLAKEFMSEWIMNKSKYSPPKSENFRDHLTEAELKFIAKNITTS
jgi:hypothetical protein